MDRNKDFAVVANFLAEPTERPRIRLSRMNRLHVLLVEIIRVCHFRRRLYAPINIYDRGCIAELCRRGVLDPISHVIATTTVVDLSDSGVVKTKQAIDLGFDLQLLRRVKKRTVINAKSVMCKWIATTPDAVDTLVDWDDPTRDGLYMLT